MINYGKREKEIIQSQERVHRREEAAQFKEWDRKGLATEKVGSEEKVQEPGKQAPRQHHTWEAWELAKLAAFQVCPVALYANNPESLY